MKENLEILGGIDNGKPYVEIVHKLTRVPYRFHLMEAVEMADHLLQAVLATGAEFNRLTMEAEAQAQPGVLVPEHVARERKAKKKVEPQA